MAERVLVFISCNIFINITFGCHDQILLDRLILDPYSGRNLLGLSTASFLVFLGLCVN